MATGFSIIKRVQSIKHALRGIWLVVKETHNLWVQLFILAAVIALGLYLDITRLDWVLIVLVSGMVIIAETFNTALEVDVDLVSPEYHPLARNIKDIAAGAVLLACVTAGVVGGFIFLPYIF